MAYTEIPTRTNTDTNASADINTLQGNVDTRVSGRYYQIDGDFNGNQTGSTSQSADGYDVFDMYTYLQTFGTGTFARSSHASTNSKPYYLTITDTSADANHGFAQNIKGNELSGKNVSVFIRAKYTTNAPTSLFIGFSADGASVKGSTTLSGFSASWVWYRADITVTAYSTTNYTSFLLTNQNSENWDLDIDKIRIIETNGLPTGTIPDWIKEDEDVEEMKQKILQYYQRKGFAFAGYGHGTAFSTSQMDLHVPIAVSFVRTPSYVINNQAFIRGNGVVTALTPTNPTGTISGIAPGSVNLSPLTFSGTPFTTNDTYSVSGQGLSDDYLDLDARY